MREELYEWLSELPAWQQDLARRLTRATHLDGDALEEAYGVVLATHGAQDGAEEAPAPTAIVLDDLPGPSDSDPTARLVGLGPLRGVGMVADDQQILFAEEGLSIIYGPNATGKSSYVSALKRVCRTVDSETSVRGNVFEPQSAVGRPSATVEYVRAGERRAQQVDLATPTDTGLDSLSVFDARCAELYLNSRNAVAYVPSSIVVLARLALAQDALRRKLDSEMATLARTRPEFPELGSGSVAAGRVEALDHESDVAELRGFTALSDQDRARAAELRAALATADARNARADAEAARQEAHRARLGMEELHALARRVSEESAAQLKREAVERQEAAKALELATAEFAALDRPGVGGDAWQRLWQAARAFVESGDSPFPPAAGESCPLCLQRLDDEAASQLGHFEQHVQSSLQARVAEADRILSESLEQVDPAQLDSRGAVFSDGVAEREPELFQAVTEFRTAVRQRMVALRADPLAAEHVALPEIPSRAVDEWAGRRDDHAAILLAAADPNGELALRKELADLDGREKLAERLDDVVKWIATLGRLEALKRAHRALATNRVTTKQRELSTEAVTTALAVALKDEVERLRCSHLPVDVEPHTAIGETHVTLRLAGAQGVPRVSEILSEGEQRAVSLAFFLAETCLAEHAGGLVVDDPVSSLDDERRSYIAKRLVREARNRQVIVFSHDLPFVLELLEEAEKVEMEPKLQGVWRLGSSVGRVDQKPPFAAMNFKQRVGELDQRVAQWDNQPDPSDADDAWYRVCDIYAAMRSTWERAVEERLFRGVVQRFQREVKTLKLPSVSVTEDLVVAIEDGMTRCSLFLHDAPAGTRTALPGRVQLAADVEKLREFERATRASG